MRILIKDIVVGERQRQDLGDLAPLATSFHDFGQAQPILVCKVDGQWKLVAGKRRLAAAESLGWTEIEAFNRDELTPEQRFILEYEEDVKRKDRTWQEKCTSAYKFYKYMKHEKYADGERWTIRAMAEGTGLEKSSIGYFIQIGEALLKQPRDEELWKCSTYFDAIKYCVANAEKRVRSELERRRALVQTSQQAAQVEGQDQALDTTEEETAVPERVYIVGHPSSFLNTPLDQIGTEIASCVLGNDVSSVYYEKIRSILRPNGFAVIWFRTIREWQQHTLAAVSSELFPAPEPLIWNTFDQGTSEWPFYFCQRYGLVLAKTKPAGTYETPITSVVNQGRDPSRQLPASVIEQTVEALTSVGMAVFCLDSSLAVHVASLSRVPIWFEPDPATYAGIVSSLREWYKENLPTVEILQR